MAHNKLYRNFIILQEDERGYSHSNDKALSGYAKVEAKGDKCKVSFYAQNLRQEDNYSMVLICCKRDLKQLIDLGPLAINGVGKGDTSKEYYVNNIAGLGISYEKISGAAICKIKDNETEFIMHGFMNGEDSADNWRKFKVVKVDSKKYINKLDEEPKKYINKLDEEPKEYINKLDEKPKKYINKLDEEPKKYINKLDEEPKEYINKLDEKPKKYINKLDEEPEKYINKFDEEPKKYINKLDEEPKKYINRLNTEPKNKDILDSSINNKVIISQSNIVETKTVKASKLESELVERKKEEDNIKSKENIEVGISNENNSKVEDKHQNRIPENHKKIAQTIDSLDEDRNKCKEAKKCEKNEETKKCYKHEMDENIEESINRLSKKLETYDGVIDFRINNLHEDIIVYGFIRDKKSNDCKWKKFKLEKKCRSESNIKRNSRRIEENFNLDKLNQTVREDRLDRLDIIDFDEYENDIQKIGSKNTEQQSSLDNMQQLSSNNNMQQSSLDNMQQLSSNNNIQQMNLENMKQVTSNQDFKINGEVGQYFEKLAEGFEPYNGSLADINYCKLYKINVNSMEDLCDESNYNKYTLAYYPMLNYYPYITKVGYFLLGYKCNKNGHIQYIVYGIPGSKETNDQPYGGRTGFVTWTSDNKNDRGYWLMFYDFKNSSIVIPTK
ncbi:hypothetical protein DIC82_04515 [Clostridium beijerinckii]|nr:hypothetical protein DIC82_04515 [Clostridium beijerinckii]